MRTIVYVDGFNLYYRALKGSIYKWLNLSQLSTLALPAAHNIVAINYYTARVSGRVDALAPARQQAYFNALSSIPNLSIYQGRFQVNDTFMFLTQPTEFRPAVANINPNPRYAKVVKTEEKGSDVNLGVHLVRDGFQGKYEHAVIITNDTDLEEPMRIVSQELGLPITLLTPVSKPATSLKNQAANVIAITTHHLAHSQFPDTLNVPGKVVTKPATW